MFLNIQNNSLSIVTVIGLLRTLPPNRTNSAPAKVTDVPYPLKMAEKTVFITQQLMRPINIVKWKVSEGNTVSIGRVILLYDFAGAEKKEQRKLKCSNAGTVRRIVAQEGAIVQPGYVRI